MVHFKFVTGKWATLMLIKIMSFGTIQRLHSFLGEGDLSKDKATHFIFDLTSILEHMRGNSLQAIWLVRNKTSNTLEEISKTVEDPQRNIELWYLGKNKINFKFTTSPVILY